MLSPIAVVAKDLVLLDAEEGPATALRAVARTLYTTRPSRGFQKPGYNPVQGSFRAIFSDTISLPCSLCVVLVSTGSF